MKNKIKALIILSMFVIVAVAVVVVAFIFNQKGFKGNRIKNPDSYLLEMERMNGTDLHTLNLQAGDVLQIQFETKKGSMHMEIKAPDGTIIYSGNGRETTDFNVNINEDGVYSISVEAKRAKGTIHISVQK